MVNREFMKSKAIVRKYIENGQQIKAYVTIRLCMKVYIYAQEYKLIL